MQFTVTNKAWNKNFFDLLLLPLKLWALLDKNKSLATSVWNFFDLSCLVFAIFGIKSISTAYAISRTK